MIQSQSRWYSAVASSRNVLSVQILLEEFGEYHLAKELGLFSAMRPMLLPAWS